MQTHSTQKEHMQTNGNNWNTCKHKQHKITNNNKTMENNI